MPVNYKSQEFFKGKDRQYSRFELKRLWCETPQRERNIDAIFTMTGIPKYHLKELAKVDEWDIEAQKEDEFKMIAKKNEAEMMSEENRRQFLEAKYEADKKLFNLAHNILNSGELEQKIMDAFKDSESPRDLDVMLKILHKIEDRYSETIGLGKPDKVNLTQNNYYDLRSAVRDEVYAGEIVEIDGE